MRPREVGVSPFWASMEGLLSITVSTELYDSCGQERRRWEIGKINNCAMGGEGWVGD